MSFVVYLIAEKFFIVVSKIEREREREREREGILTNISDRDK
jgi:hypothetical protein